VRKENHSTLVRPFRLLILSIPHFRPADVTELVSQFNNFLFIDLQFSCWFTFKNQLVQDQCRCAGTCWQQSFDTSVIMAALWNRAGHYIFVLWFLLSSSFYLLFFLACSQPSQIGCLPYFHTGCGLSANLGCSSEICCTGLAENTGRKKSPKIRNLCTIAQACRAISLQLRHISTIVKTC